MQDVLDVTTSVSAAMQARKNKHDNSLDPERGNCLLLYADKLGVLSFASETQRMHVLKAVYDWFMLKKDEAAAIGDVLKSYENTRDYGNLSIPEKQQAAKDNIRAAAQSLIDAQKGNAAHFLEVRDKKRKGAMRRWQKERERSEREKLKHEDGAQSSGELD